MNFKETSRRSTVILLESKNYTENFFATFFSQSLTNTFSLAVTREHSHSFTFIFGVFRLFFLKKANKINKRTIFKGFQEEIRQEQEVKATYSTMNSILITGCNRGLGLGLVKSLLKLEQTPKYIFATCRNLEKADVSNSTHLYRPVPL